MRTAIICPVWNNLGYTKLMINSVIKNTYDFELFIVDNGSTDGTSHYLSGRKDVKVITLDANYGYGGGVNEGVRVAYKGNFDYFCIINNDVIATKNWLVEILKVFKDENVWVAGPRFTNGKIPGKFPPDLKDTSPDGFKPDTYYTFPKITGFCYVVSRKCVEERMKNGFFLNPIFAQMWYEDTELEAWLREKGHPAVIVNTSYVHHFESKTVNVHPDKMKYVKENCEKFKAMYPDYNRDKLPVTYKPIPKS